jgi:hypothetical protein
MRENPSPAMQITRPGKAPSHHSVRKYGCASAIIVPQSGAGGGTPSPRNPRVVMKMMISTASENA